MTWAMRTNVSRRRVFSSFESRRYFAALPGSEEVRSRSQTRLSIRRTILGMARSRSRRQLGTLQFATSSRGSCPRRAAPGRGPVAEIPRRVVRVRERPGLNLYPRYEPSTARDNPHHSPSIHGPRAGLKAADTRFGTMLTAWILLSTRWGSAHGEMSCGSIAIGALELREAAQAWATEGAAPTYSSPYWKRSAFAYTGSAATSLPGS